MCEKDCTFTLKNSKPKVNDKLYVFSGYIGWAKLHSKLKQADERIESK